MDIPAKIRDYIATNFLFSDDGFGYDDDASFLEEGIVDSVGIMELVTFVEDNFGFSVNDEDLTPDNFDSVAKLTDYIERHLKK